MTSPPFLRHNLSIAEALSRSGVKGGVIPQFRGDVQPVMVLADLSDSYSGEPLEARGLVGGEHTGIPAGFRAFARMQSLAPGGTVVEFADFSVNSFSLLAFVDITEELVAGLVESERVVLQCGGAVASNRVFSGWTAAAVSGAGPMFIGGTTGGGTTLDLRIYVPSGSLLYFFASSLSTGGDNLNFRFLWREVPAGIGLP